MKLYSGTWKGYNHGLKKSGSMAFLNLFATTNINLLINFPDVDIVQHRETESRGRFSQSMIGESHSDPEKVDEVFRVGSVMTLEK